MVPCSCFLFFFFFNDTATTEIYTLSLHDALPIFSSSVILACAQRLMRRTCSHCKEPVTYPAKMYQDLNIDPSIVDGEQEDRKSTRLNSSHGYISYAVFCLKKKKTSQATQASAHAP